MSEGKGAETPSKRSSAPTRTPGGGKAAANGAPKSAGESGGASSVSSAGDGTGASGGLELSKDYNHYAGEVKMSSAAPKPKPKLGSKDAPSSSAKSKARGTSMDDVTVVGASSPPTPSGVGSLELSPNYSHYAGEVAVSDREGGPAPKPKLGSASASASASAASAKKGAPPRNSAKRFEDEGGGGDGDVGTAGPDGGGDGSRRGPSSAAVRHASFKGALEDELEEWEKPKGQRAMLVIAGNGGGGDDNDLDPAIAAQIGRAPQRASAGLTGSTVGAVSAPTHPTAGRSVSMTHILRDEFEEWEKPGKKGGAAGNGAGGGGEGDGGGDAAASAGDAMDPAVAAKLGNAPAGASQQRQSAGFKRMSARVTKLDTLLPLHDGEGGAGTGGGANVAPKSKARRPWLCGCAGNDAV